MDIGHSAAVAHGAIGLPTLIGAASCIADTAADCRSAQPASSSTSRASPGPPRLRAAGSTCWRKARPAARSRDACRARRSAVVEHDDLVGVDDGREPVRDHQRRAVADTRSSASWMSRSVWLSSAEVASSSIRIGGSLRMVRAMATRCFSPPRASGRARRPRCRSPSATCPMKRRSAPAARPPRPPRRSLPAAVADVVADRVVEQHGVLRDHADRGAQRSPASRRGCPGRRSGCGRRSMS